MATLSGVGSAKASATIVKSAICRTTARFRPSPSLFFFPGLKSSPYWNARSFPWVAQLEAATDEIRGEFLALRAAGEQAGGRTSDYATGTDEHTLHDGRWDWHSWRQGAAPPSTAFERACPVTVAALSAVPGLMQGLPFAYAFFSTLHAGASIRPHSAPCNLRLRCHLPLIVPDSEVCEGDVAGLATCGMRVAEHAAPWEVGHLTMFDDCYEHETWNDTASERVVLLFDVWHPELALEEREAVQVMFAESLGKSRKAKSEWGV